MTNGDQVQGGQQGGGRTYSEEDVMALMNEAARRAAAEAIKNVPRNDEEEDVGSVINPKVVKQLKDTVAVFTALKDLSSNPLQRTIEETVGGMAASVVQSAFAPRGPPPKKDIVDTLLNSQFAFGLGSGLGQRAPELVETMGRTFGTDKAGQMIENVIGKYGSGGGGSRQLAASPNPPSGNPGPSQSEQKMDKQSEKELLLSLDPNNPEHVSAYAETQGGLPIDVARKMLMIHQDAFIGQMKKEGMNIDQISTQRGSHIQPPSSSSQQDKEQTPPHPAQQRTPAKPVQPNIQPEIPDIGVSDIYEEPIPSNPGEMQYAEYQDMSKQQNQQNQQNQQGHANNNIDDQQDQQGYANNNIDDQQMEMMKSFATDIGKVMGEMMNKIESLNNTMFTLQNEVNTIKKQETSSVPPSIQTPVRTRVPSEIPLRHIEEPSLEIFKESDIETGIKIKEPEPKSSEEFFEEDIKSTSDFLKELEEDAKRDIEKLKQKEVPLVPPGQVPQTKIDTELSPVVQMKELSPPVTIPTSPIIESKEKKETIKGIENKDIDNKNINRLVRPIRKVGITKKSEHGKIQSFKKGENIEDKEVNSDKEV